MTLISRFLFLGMISLGCISCQQEVKRQAEVPPPKGLISLEKATILFQNYANNRVSLIDDHEKLLDSTFQASRFVSFSYQELQTYMRYLDAQARKTGITPESIRVYLGNQGAAGTGPQKRQNTVFFMPMLDAEKAWYGSLKADGMYTPLLSGWDLRPLPKLFQQHGGSTNKAGFFPGQDAETSFHSTIMNEGSSGPPPPQNQ